MTDPDKDAAPWLAAARAGSAEALVLRYYEERSFEEIARVMGRSTNAIHKLWLRAIKPLQQDVEGAP
jgi:DNA-directed RNA polymerase specialized sigma24 family protein